MRTPNVKLYARKNPRWTMTLDLEVEATGEGVGWIHVNHLADVLRQLGCTVHLADGMERNSRR